MKVRVIVCQDTTSDIKWSSSVSGGTCGGRSKNIALRRAAAIALSDAFLKFPKPGPDVFDFSTITDESSTSSSSGGGENDHTCIAD